MVTKLSVANTINSQIESILKGSPSAQDIPLIHNSNGLTYYVLSTMTFNKVDTEYYTHSWQNYRYAIVFDTMTQELSIVSMLGATSWGSTQRYRRLNECYDYTEDILYLVNIYIQLGKDYYEVDSIENVFGQSKYRGLGKIDYIWHGSQADPELIYDKESFCYWDVEDALWDMYKEECEDLGAQALNERFNKWLFENEERVYGMLDEWVANLRVEA